MPDTAQVASATTVATLSASRTVRLAGAGLSLIAVCYGLARFAYGLFLPSFRETFALSAGQAGLIASAGYAAYCVGTVAATVTTARFGARAVSVAAGVLATVGTAMIALAPTGLVLAVGVTVAGTSTGLASPALAHAIEYRVAPARRDRVQTVVNAGTGLGVMLSGPVALLAHDRWRAAWLAFAIITAAVTVWVWIRVPTTRDHAAGTAGGTGRSRLPLPAGALRLFAAAVAVGVASSATWTFGQELLETAGGHGRTLATTAWIVLGACGLLGAASGDLTRRLGLRRAWTLSTLALGLATALLAAAAPQAAVAVGASAAFGALYIALTGILLLWSIRIHPARPAAAVGLTFLLVAVGQSAAAPLLGVVTDRTGLTTAFWLSAAVALLAAALAPPARLRTA
ncbi:MFS transporter [Rhodococcus sp. SGAir0479]|uniref:MFS transporter n=1 Tax=Rhodococcus sp. SGAir0479 TaxID=2567884 RepID=UPI0010CCDE04|nr:MFS transporter [Rhodococcus sp. SGAir0479]QCQ91404.1 YbfB/YjiJ family MFS transporter [Rhodococcus sp. SGAir0479]